MTTVKLKWWDAANDRRQELILKKWETNDPMTDAEILELILLQDLAEQVLSYDRDLMLILASKSANTSSGYIKP
jgi:hypothetical protein